MRRAIAIALGLFTWASVAACAHQMDMRAASAPTWNLYMIGDEAKLAYGPPNTDLVGVMMSCQRGSGAVTVSGDVPEDQPQLVLVSGDSRLRLKGPAEVDPFGAGPYMEASAPSSAPALARFARTGDLALGTTSMRASSKARGDIRRFFAHCEA
jgi:hypothetical protein